MLYTLLSEKPNLSEEKFIICFLVGTVIKIFNFLKLCWYEFT